MENTTFYLLLVVIVSIIIIIILGSLLFYRHYLRNSYSIKNENNSIQKIPKIIIQTWKDDFIPERYHDLLKKINEFNPEYNYLFFSDNDIDDFLSSKYPKYYETYLKLPVKIQKFDFFRYVVLYHYGGIYLDLDMLVLDNFDDILHKECVIPIEQYVNKDQKRYKNIKNDFLLGNYALACEKRNDFMKMLIDNIHLNITNINDTFENGFKNKLEKEIFVYETTGPDYVTNCYIDYKNKKDIQLLINPKSFNNRNHTFGKYARHLYFGSWKK
jgi:mannosyltransferase OCH1-like enzyme